MIKVLKSSNANSENKELSLNITMVYVSLAFNIKYIYFNLSQVINWT